MKEMVPKGLDVVASATVLVYVVLAASDLLAFPARSPASFSFWV